MKCQGKGTEIIVKRTGQTTHQTQRQCSVCNGDGSIIDSKNRCAICNGEKFIQQTKKLEVNIARGSENGETIKINGEGNEIVSSRR